MTQTVEERKEEQSLQQKWPRCLVCARWHDPKTKCPLSKQGEVKAHHSEGKTWL